MILRPLRPLLSRTSARPVARFHISHTRWAARTVVQRFKLADIGEGITECEVIKWNVSPPAPIQAFDPLCEVQSDKASVEITSPFDGVVTELLVKEGAVAKVGEALCLIEVRDDSAAPEAPAPTTAEPGPAAPTPKPDVAAPAATRNRHPMDPEFVPSPRADVDVLAAPAVRHFARTNGVDLAALAPGSGRDGRVEKRDVEAFLQGSQITAEKVPTGKQVGEDVVVELGRTRYGMWKAMVKSLEIPHFGYSTTLDLTSLHNMLPTLNAHIPAHYLVSPPNTPVAISPSAIYPAPSPPPVLPIAQYKRLTMLPLLIKTLAKSMLEWPLLRASIVHPTTPDARPALAVRPHADISIALATPTGLYTPTLPAADTYSAYALASELARLAALGRQTPCGLTPADMPRRGGTLTVSNVGAIGRGDFAAPVLVPGGGVAIVAIGRAKWVWDVERGDGRGERRLQVGVSWSADHRVVEGAELAAFVECWRGYVENPERLIADGI